MHRSFAAKKAAQDDKRLFLCAERVAVDVRSPNIDGLMSRACLRWTG